MKPIYTAQSMCAINVEPGCIDQYEIENILFEIKKNSLHAAVVEETAETFARLKNVTDLPEC